MLEQTAIDKLVDSNLLVCAYDKNSPYSGGYSICKPKSVIGNKRTEYEVYCGDEEILCDAPCTSLYPQNGRWIVEVWEFIPGPGLGDFQLAFDQIDDAVSSIIDYYFGNPLRMNPPELLERSNS